MVRALCSCSALWRSFAAVFASLNMQTPHTRIAYAHSRHATQQMLQLCCLSQSILLFPACVPSCQAGLVKLQNCGSSVPDVALHQVTLIQPYGQDVKMVAWHPSGEVLVSASYDDTIKLWMDSDDEWICVQTLSGMSGPSLVSLC